MKKLILILGIMCLWVGICNAQVMNINTGTLMWDAVANPKNGTVTIPGVMKYQVYTKNTIIETPGQKVGGEITATQLLMSFLPYVPYYPGVQAIFYPTASPTTPGFSTMAWSHDPACAPMPFSVLFSPTIDSIKNLRIPTP